MICTKKQPESRIPTLLFPATSVGREQDKGAPVHFNVTLCN